MRIAVIGSGVSGLTTAYLLSRKHDVTVYEKNDYIGGHTHTIPVALDGDGTPTIASESSSPPAGSQPTQPPPSRYRVDTGFIVFNEKNYPNFLRLLKTLNVDWQPSQMSFSVCCERTGLEYGFANLRALFCQPRNLISPSFLRMLYEIGKFRRQSEALLADQGHEQELDDFLSHHGFSSAFRDHFLTPFGAAIWSAEPEEFQHFPMRNMARFFRNHGFLNPKELLPWRVVRGGSDRYIAPLTQPFADRIYRSTPVRRLRRLDEGVELVFDDGTARFDQVVVAAHSDQALAMLTDPTPAEQAVLGAIPYQPNETVLHTDASLLPQSRHAWSSWNYRVPRNRAHAVTVTYDMNILQSLDAPVEFCVTLNLTHKINNDTIIGTYHYDHPIYRPDAVTAQARHAEISGVNGIHYCGAYWGYGFHEDGVCSALRVCKAFGEELN